MTRARAAATSTGTALLAAALLSWPALASGIDPFYQGLLDDGLRSYARGDHARARAELRIAAFGLLETPAELARALAHLALAQSAGNDVEGFERSYRRLTELESRFRAYSAAALGADVRGALDLAARQHLGTAALGYERPAAPTAPAVEVAEAARPQLCVSWTGDGACRPVAAAPASSQPSEPLGPTPEALASFDRLYRLTTARVSDKKLRSSFEQAGRLADRYPDWPEMQRVAAVLGSRSGAFADAVRYYERAGESTEDRPLQLFYLSVALFETDQVDAAATVLRRALPTLRPNREVRKYMKRILNEESAG